MLYNALLIAFATYSRIPMPSADWNDTNRRYSMCFFPLVGTVTGIAVSLCIYLCGLCGISDIVKGAVCAALPIIITGGIHMDGFMDTQDAMASWQPMEKRLEILKDTHTGAFAVIFCGLYMILNAAFASQLKAADIPAVICAYTVSRSLSALTLSLFKSARPGGMLDGFAKSAHKRAVISACVTYICVCLAVCLFSDLITALLCVLACSVCVLVYRHRAYKYFGGITGDLAGWFVQITELSILASILLGGML